jgi:hypothetical protein
MLNSQEVELPGEGVRCHSMFSLEERIAKTQRLLRRLEEDKPYLRMRLSPLGAEHRQSATAFANRIRIEAEAELRRLMAESAAPNSQNVQQRAD